MTIKIVKKLLIIVITISLFSVLINTKVQSADDSCSNPTVCTIEDDQNNNQDGNFDQYRPQDESGKVCVYYFWGAGCKACASVSPFVEELTSQKKDKVELKSLEVYYNEENRKLLSDFNKRYQVEDSGVPAVFVGDTYLGGADAIKNNLSEKIDYFYENKTACPLDYNRIQGSTEETKKLELTLPAILLGAAADSVNPCAFAVLIFLLVYLMAVKDKKAMFKVGLTYIIVVFVVYFVSGLGILQLAKYLTATSVVMKIVASISIVAGLINIKDFFWYGKGISLHIPESKKPLIERYVKKATFPATIVLGFLVSAFELPCTGGVYLAILGILAQSSDKLLSIFYLLIYNVIFVSPLLIILLVVYKGLDPDKVNSWRLDKRKWLRLFMGLIMLILGFGLFFGLF
ncbi:hypothetical protein A2X44_05090 [candidate division CPR3 bacterium GWF2_35_18]|uniref:Cytochrome c biogenesis protein, transmembrane region n=1 Tax=candidate division CPR3 bacterium GW2011_GWF2_35_18 TaxID=1618350 RepID=A0A0G0ER84_UNCC3|nr:MAG: Cytochrome c biogenesis protein, transmembrane region [candidate division CPR3 bacterium GW2011_GWF2_35_18]KKP87247.1 MAG: Cytochrome c biogenesis protein, transmembrane region [candidate division CPR3 bacterium GW2011_GWE2_35_7]OGB63705.1 MAG: hypothetical protein A2X44_05090 [candidate division CPR3 bacterium GWF2_35_18]OGB64975.1 MAG: hypothetical protein A2250_00955 [candidate division CPR3 bacterium RIFOXYA2_FULL_35_13]OGB76206.1 MAG: hypothetical protein A2476_05055 [candidate div